jgi:hypothetical protein
MENTDGRTKTCLPASANFVIQYCGFTSGAVVAVRLAPQLASRQHVVVQHFVVVPNVVQHFVVVPDSENVH